MAQRVFFCGDGETVIPYTSLFVVFDNERKIYNNSLA